MTPENRSVSGRQIAARRRSAGTHAAAGRGPGTSCFGPGGRRAWSPPVLPADTPVKRRVDHILPRTGLPAVAYFAAVIGLLGLAQILPAPAYLAVDAVAFLAGGTWCALNFWRCRHAHCLLTGSGWLLLALFAAAEAGLGRSLMGGDEQLVFLVILAMGLIFEGAWYLLHRDNTVTPAQTEPASRAAVQRQK
jgi:hypothetical protein